MLLFKIGQPDLIRDPFEWEIISRSLVSMTVVGTFGFILALLCEVKFFAKIGKTKKNLQSLLLTNQIEDDDVENERNRVDRIAQLNREEDLIIVKNISKTFLHNKAS